MAVGSRRTTLPGHILIQENVMADDLEEAIRDNATGPAEAHGDSGGMRQHSLPDQIEADRYLESKKASRKKGLGIRTVKLSPPGTV